MCKLGKRGRLKGVGRGSNTLTWECSLSRESLFTFKIPAVTVIAICHPITVLLDNRKLPAPPPPALFTAGEQLLCLRALGASCRGGSGSCSCCFSFMKCTHLSLLEGARGEPCQGSDNPTLGSGVACCCHHLPQLPCACGEVRDARGRHSLSPQQLSRRTRGLGTDARGQRGAK